MHQHSQYKGTRRRENVEGNILEYIIAENFPILGKETDFLVENWKSETGSTQRGH